jgi:putative membrane-bound dehydrogenase-like protein
LIILRPSIACLVMLAALALARPSAKAPSSAGPAFTVPPGFVVERVAAPPLVDRPITADFDERGRLYVADSSGSNAKVEQQLVERPHRILRLEDTDGDGRFDDRTVFADRMMLPQGTLWHDGSLYVAAPPSIWRLTDTDDDGVADLREEWFAGRTLTGCANDLHGPYLGPDGWIYWTKGAFAEQTYDQPGQEPLVTRAAHIFRRRPETSVVESVIAGGMDNPVDVAFTAAGDAVFTATFLEHPKAGRRDALIHAVYGGVYGKPHGVIDSHPQTGELMPPICHLGPAAPSGLTRYASAAFGERYRDSFFAALFNMQKVTRHELVPSGATFKSRDSDFLVSDSLDFHPTDVIEDADGSLLVVDTGAWYKLCCPTSQLAKPDVLGGIYRVRRRAAPPLADPWGTALQWREVRVDQLVARLDDARPAVQQRAITVLARRGRPAIAAVGAAVGAGRSPRQRLNAIWALTRIDASEAREAVRPALADRHLDVRRAATHSAGLWRDAGAVPWLLEQLASKEPHARRAAAEALGRIGDPAAVPRLLSAAALPLDRVGAHSVTYALIEIADPGSTRPGLTGRSVRTRRAALLALDHMRNGGLAPDAVVPLLDSGDAELSEAAWRVVSRHKDWGAALIPHFERRLSQLRDQDADEVLERRIAAHAGAPVVQAWLARRAVDGAAASRMAALRVMAAARLTPLPDAWVAAIGAALAAPSSRLARQAVQVALSTPGALDEGAPVRDQLLSVSRDSRRPDDVRMDALAAAVGKGHPLDERQFALVQRGLDAANPVPLRLSAAGIVERARLAPSQLQALVEIVRESGPLELSRLLPAFAGSADERLGLDLVAALERAPGRASLRADILRPRLAGYPRAVRDRGETLLASLASDAATEARRLDDLVGSLVGGGDLRRGQSLFNSAKAACASCHAIGYRGGTIGPDLTAVGQIRSERDLLEAIVFPNASFARGYEPVVVTTVTGAAHAGVLKEEGLDAVVILSATGEETRVPREGVASLLPARVSVMPTGYGEQLTRQELADLVAFLKNTKWGAN